MKKIFSVIMISIALFSAIKLLIYKISPLSEKQHFWIKKTFVTSKFDILVAGDSRVYRGVSPKAINSKLNRPSKIYNLGYSSAGFSEEYFEFVTSKFRKNRESKILILGVTPHSLTKEAFKNEHLHQFLNLSKIEISKSLHLTKLNSFFSAIDISVLLKELSYPGNIEDHYIQNYTKYGWIISDQKRRDNTEALKSYRKTFSKYKVTPKEVDSFLKNISTCINQGFTVIVFRPPTSIKLKVLEDTLSGYQENDIKKRVQKLGAYWLDIDIKKFETYDGSHLTPESSIKLSKFIGDYIEAKGFQG